MAQAEFIHEGSVDRCDAVSHGLSVSIYADRAHLRGQLRDDAVVVGLRVGQVSGLAALLSDADRPLGDVVMIDCPDVDAPILAGLAAIDMQASRTGTQLVVSTSVDALDDVFGCLDQSGAQILVDPGRAELVLALGRALVGAQQSRLRELSDEDRLTLLRLAEQVEGIAVRLDRLAPPAGGEARGERAFRFESPRPAFTAQPEDGSARLVRASRPSLPDPRMIRRIVRQRQLRGRFFDADLFADPAWDMLLDLTAARAEHTRVSVTSLCIASGVPPTTALRWIGQMIDAGLLERIEDETDRRRAFVALTDKAAESMARYFAELGREAVRIV